jgi:hypothetical protein
MAATALFVEKVGRDPIIFDDHGDTLYGLYLFEQGFPRWVLYNPFWNAGTIEWEPLRHGTLNLFWISRPLRLLLPLTETYNLVIPMVFLFGIPWLIYYALGLFQFSTRARLMGVLFAILPHLQQVYWISVGCVPAIISSALTPALLLLSVRLFLVKDPGWLHLGLWVLLASLALMWMPLGILILIFYRRLSVRNKKFLLLAGAAFLVVNLPWIFSFFTQYDQEAIPALNLSWSKVTLKNIYLVFLTLSIHFNPLLLFLCPVGFYFLRPPLRLAAGLFTFYLLFLLLLDVSIFKGSYSLNRMDVPLAFLLIIPAVAALDKISLHYFSGRLALWLMIPFFLLQGMGALFFYNQQISSRVQEAVTPDTLTLAQYLNSQTTKEGRIFLTGRTVHEYGGHAAFLQMLTDRPIVAIHYYDMADTQSIGLPALLGDGPPPAEQFYQLLNLYNITTLVDVVNSERQKWNDYLNSLPFLMKKMEVGPYRVFAAGIKPSYFLKGSGKVSFSLNQIEVWPGNEERLVLKFNYHERLSGPRGLAIKPYSVGEGIQFIELTALPKTAFTLRYR